MNDNTSIEVSIPSDENGYRGQECPECERYFKVKGGTGIPKEIPCNCPYCGYQGKDDEFFTNDQIEYAKSVAFNKFEDDLFRELKKVEVKPKRNSFFSIGIKVTGSPSPIAYYSEKELEQIVTCEVCTLEYAIYGAFGFCPDCGNHNSLQIFRANISIIEKMLALAEKEKTPIKEKLIENCLEDAISAFDGFGRECCNVFSNKSKDPLQSKKLSFQNITTARKKILNLFGFDFADLVNKDDYEFTLKQFNKRHLLAHKMSVIDKEFVNKTGSSESLIGTKVTISRVDVMKLLNCLEKMAVRLYNGLK